MGWIVTVAVVALIVGVGMTIVGFGEGMSDDGDSFEVRRARWLFAIGLPLCATGGATLVSAAMYLIARHLGL